MRFVNVRRAAGLELPSGAELRWGSEENEDSFDLPGVVDAGSL
jgi:hypothetical protein